MDSPKLRRETFLDDRNRHVLEEGARVIIGALFEHQTPVGDNRASIDVSLSVEACLLAAAAIIQTSRDAVEDCAAAAGANLVAYARRFAKDELASGKSALQQLGIVAAADNGLN